ncbi:hypothetical protein PRZ48_011980 [Zasmidium cellare]|uniref:Glycosyl hydrolase family 95 N-terminal domain-containing protein n=1 Tax=Zasmidium cellare TaxID=395010 RepID=A0ABR0E7Y4_ZASCE|nr:hypothetical protein PRZ48_011980 [Zasmidium cellare]
MHLSAVTALLLSTCPSVSLAKSLWSTKPAVSDDVLRTSYPIGNGKIAALPFGEAGHETLSINRDTLWSGGPFENSSYAGGNAGQRYQFLPGIRDWIWQNGTGNVTKLQGDNNNYGAYAVLGNLTVTIDGVQDVTNYKRVLDLGTGVHTTTYSTNGSAYTIESYCTYPDEVCVYDISSTRSLPSISISMSNTLTNATLVKSTCSQNQVQLRGTTKADIGMIYQATTRVLGHNLHTRCSNGSLVLPASSQRRATFVIAAGTNFDQTKGNAENDYSFRGIDPSSYVESTVERASAKNPDQLLESHIADYSALADAFSFDLPDTQGSSKLETAELVSRYDANGTTGDPYLESLTFDLARHLFISSSRDGSLPPNLQGKWSAELMSAWSADYHANINIQMNHWHADQTGLGGLQAPLWGYLAQNWAPRGAETARLLYNAPGWVVHNEMNIFGHTSMKTGDEIWADYPIAAAWMMLHVWDHFDYSQDAAFLRSTGYPLLKQISQFWLSQLQKDQYFKDGTLVVNPCTSAEHGATTFGGTHYQQLIYQLFETTLQSATAVGDHDRRFLSDVQNQLPHLDKGLHIGKWNQIQEWKLDMDVQNDTHRHLSNLIGWHPGFSLSSYQNGYNNDTIRRAVETTLYSRGIGIADSNAGWEKVWRAACWARLKNVERAHYELRLTIGENWAGNLLSMYSGANLPFQIDANFGFAGAVLSMLVVDLPLSNEQMRRRGREARTVVLGPAIPAAWGNGNVRGLRLRGGGIVDFSWDGDGMVTKAKLGGSQQAVRVVNKEGKVLAQSGGTPGWYWGPHW